jgi:diguanylate cyclase (GGDEF)-like protein/PAS domain S-box-containing protein
MTANSHDKRITGLNQTGSSSEMKKNVQALRRNSVEKLHSLFENTDQGICCLDSAGACTYVNPAFLRMLGYAHPADLLGKNIHQLTGYSFAGRSAMSFGECAIVKALQEGESSHSDDEVFVRSDGSAISVDYYCFPEVVESRIHGAIVTIVDNSKRRQAEEELRATRERFQGLVETMYDWIWEVDSQGRYTYVSPQVRNILGYEPDEVLGKSPYDFMPDEEAKRLSEKCGSLIRERQPIVALENLNVHKEGRLVILETNGLPFYDEHGRFQGYRGADRDITKRKHAEENLRRNEETLREAHRIAKLGDWEFDFGRNEWIWSDSLYELLELNPQACSPSYEGFLDRIHPEDREAMDAAHVNSIKTHGSSEISCRLQMQDARIKWINQIFRAERDAMGYPLKLFGIVQDITELREAMEKVRHMANHDFLTELATMRLARDRLSMAINRANRERTMLAVMFIDLDGFKEINDHFGHDVGDSVLRHVAGRLVSGVRSTNTVARAGGDEFLIIATDIGSREDAAVVAEKALRLLSEPINLGGEHGKAVLVSASIGIALYPDDGNTIDALIKAADAAMYRVKNSRKNGYEFVSSVAKRAAPG